MPAINNNSSEQVTLPPKNEGASETAPSSPSPEPPANDTSAAAAGKAETPAVNPSEITPPLSSQETRPTNVNSDKLAAAIAQAIAANQAQSTTGLTGPETVATGVLTAFQALSSGGPDQVANGLGTGLAEIMLGFTKKGQG